MVAIKAGDIMEANRRLVEDVRASLLQDALRKASARLLTKEQVMHILSVSAPTLWRWGKVGYLVPVEVGGQVRYRSQDIDAIVEGKSPYIALVESGGKVEYKKRREDAIEEGEPHNIEFVSKTNNVVKQEDEL